MRTLSGLVWLGLVCGIGCGPEPDTPPPPRFSVVSWNLGSESQADASTREAAAIDYLRTVDADVLFLQATDPGVSPRRMGEALGYPHQEVLQRESPYQLSCLSRVPITMTAHTNDTYRVGDESLHVLRGFQQIDLSTDSTPVRLIHFNLKSKAFHPLKQSEMRRNEARLLRQLIRGMHKEDPEHALILCGTLNASPVEAISQQVRGDSAEPLFEDLRPTDSTGHAWTVHERMGDHYERWDVIFVNARAKQLIEGRTVLDAPSETGASHRPLRLELK